MEPRAGNTHGWSGREVNPRPYYGCDFVCWVPPFCPDSLKSCSLFSITYGKKNILVSRFLRRLSYRLLSLLDTPFVSRFFEKLLIVFNDLRRKRIF